MSKKLKNLLKYSNSNKVNSLNLLKLSNKNKLPKHNKA